MFAADPEELSTCGQNAQIGRRANERRHRVRGVRQELLEVVEDEKGRLIPKPYAERLRDRLLRRFLDADRPRDRRFDQTWIPEGGEVHEPRPVRETRPDRPGDGKRETSLARSA